MVGVYVRKISPSNRRKICLKSRYKMHYKIKEISYTNTKKVIITMERWQSQAERGRLEICFKGNLDGGSNPSLSAYFNDLEIITDL